MLSTKRFLNNMKSCSCSMPGVWRAVAYDKGAVVIFHSPRACSHVAQSMDLGTYYRTYADAMQETMENVPVLTSQMLEKHTIFGGTDRLQACLDYAVQTYHPELVVIASSCLAGVIGDDVAGVAADAEKKYGIPVIASESCGFLDGEYSQGFYEIANKIVDRYFRPVPKQPGTVLLLGDNGGPWGDYVRETVRLLNALGLKVLGQFPGYMPVRDFAGAAAAEATVLLGNKVAAHQRQTELAERLQKEFGRAYLKDEYPVGWSGTCHWIEAMGRLLHREEAAARVLAREQERFGQKLAAFRRIAAGTKTVLCFGRWLQFFDPASVLETARNLQLDVQGIVLLDSYPPAEREKMAAFLRACTDLPVRSRVEAEPLVHGAELVLTTHELRDRSLRQIFLPMVPLAGTAGEIRIMGTVCRVLQSKIGRGGVVYA